MIRDSKHSFSVFHLNIRSLNANKDELFQLISALNSPFDVLVLSEIWSFNIDFYSKLFPEFNFYYSLPISSHVGGIGIYVHNSYSTTTHTVPIPTDIAKDVAILILEIS